MRVGIFQTKLLLSYLALRELKQMAIKKFLIPGDAGWPLGGLYPLPETAAEGGTLNFVD